MMDPDAEKQETPSCHELAMKRSTSFEPTSPVVGAIKRSSRSLTPKAEAKPADLVALKSIQNKSPDDGS